MLLYLDLAYHEAINRCDEAHCSSHDRRDHHFVPDGTHHYPPVFAIWKWNFEVKPTLKQEGPMQPEPLNIQEPVHA
jgi:hypothetical protein